MKKVFISAIIIYILTIPQFLLGAAPTAGSLIKMPCANAKPPVQPTGCDAVYYLGEDGYRYVFPNGKIFSSWYSDFSQVKEITKDELFSYPIKIGKDGQITYRPGAKLIKAYTDPKVYAVSKAGALRWISSENLAQILFGLDWLKIVDDLPDAFLSGYTPGSDILSKTDYNRETEQQLASNISMDKGLLSVDKPQEKPTPEATPSSQITVPKITDTKILNISASIASVFWKTDIEADSVLSYSQQELTEKNLGTRLADSNFLLEHSFTLSGLTPSTTYYIQLQSTDEKGNTSEYAKLSFPTTNQAKKDWEKFFITQYLASPIYPQVAVNNDTVGFVFLSKNQSGNNSVYFSAMKRDGGLKGPNIKVSKNDNLNAESPAISKSSTGFVVVWSEYSTLDSTLPAKILFVSLDTKGNLLSVINTVTTDDIGTPPRGLQIASDGTGFGLVWHEQRKETAYEEVYFTYFDNIGKKIIKDTKITGEGEHSTRTDIAYNFKDGFGITYRRGLDSSGIYFILVDNKGLKSFFPVDKKVNQSYNLTPSDPNIYWDGSEFDIAWSDFFLTSQYYRKDVSYVRYQDTGATTTRPIQLTENEGTIDSHSPKIVGKDGLYHISWQNDNNKIFISTIDQGSSYKREKQLLIEAQELLGYDMVFDGINLIYLWSALDADGQRKIFFMYGR